MGFTPDAGKYHHISLGQGQEVVADGALKNGAEQGHWVILEVSNVTQYMITASCCVFIPNCPYSKLRFVQVVSFFQVVSYPSCLNLLHQSLVQHCCFPWY